VEFQGPNIILKVRRLKVQNALEHRIKCKKEAFGALLFHLSARR
jgi:hypothetical protein